MDFETDLMDTKNCLQWDIELVLEDCVLHVSYGTRASQNEFYLWVDSSCASFKQISGLLSKYFQDFWIIVTEHCMRPHDSRHWLCTWKQNHCQIIIIIIIIITNTYLVLLFTTFNILGSRWWLIAWLKPPTVISKVTTIPFFHVNLQQSCMWSTPF